MLSNYRGQPNPQPRTLPPATRHLLRPCIAASVAMAAFVTVTKSAEAAAKYPRKVRQVLDYINTHPMPLDSMPMIYEKDPQTPLPDVIQGLTPEDVKASPETHPHWATVVAALLYVACGGLDHAHNLVTPLSWGSPTSYGGKPVPGSPAAKEAAYVHALVHRREGDCDGEFGSGFSNANYWYAATGLHPIHPQILEAATAAAAGNPRLQQFVHNHGNNFSPQKFVSLCSQAASAKDPELMRFCERVMMAEWKLLFDYCVSKL